VNDTIIKNNDTKNNPPESADASGEVSVLDGIERPRELSADGIPSGVEIDRPVIPILLMLKNIHLKQENIPFQWFLREFEGKRFETLPKRMRIRIEETELDFVTIDLFNNHLNKSTIVYNTTNQSHPQRMAITAMSPVRI
jgi:hypothetical protein